MVKEALQKEPMYVRTPSFHIYCCKKILFVTLNFSALKHHYDHNAHHPEYYLSQTEDGQIIKENMSTAGNGLNHEHKTSLNKPK